MVSIVLADLAEGKSWSSSRVEQRRQNRIYLKKQKEGFLAVEDFHAHPIAPTPPPPPQAKPSSTTKENSEVGELAEMYAFLGRTFYY